MKFLILFLLPFTCFSQDIDWHKYNQAAEKSVKIKKLKKPRSLFNISSSNGHLDVMCNPRWGCSGGISNWQKGAKFKEQVRVKMVSWVSAGTAKKYFAPHKGQNKPYNTGSGHLWVTAFPQVKKFCRSINSSNVKERIEQYLGLPPTGRKTHFVEVWVRPQDLFRPCYDLEVYDTTCDYAPSRSISMGHKDWMKKTFASTYPAKGTKTPWTRLGFTYDWGNPGDPIGASEYVINLNSDIYVESITPTGIYCAK